MQENIEPQFRKRQTREHEEPSAVEQDQRPASTMRAFEDTQEPPLQKRRNGFGKQITNVYHVHQHGSGSESMARRDSGIGFGESKGLLAQLQMELKLKQLQEECSMRSALSQFRGQHSNTIHHIGNLNHTNLGGGGLLGSLGGRKLGSGLDQLLIEVFLGNKIMFVYYLRNGQPHHMLMRGRDRCHALSRRCGGRCLSNTLAVSRRWQVDACASPCLARMGTFVPIFTISGLRYG